MSENNKNATELDLSLQAIEKKIKSLQIQKEKLLAANRSVEKGNAINLVQYACAKDGNKKIVVIGGQGQLGSLFVRLFDASGYQVNVIDKDDWKNAEESLKDAVLVLVAVPIHLTKQVIQRLKNLPQGCILADVTSIKQQPLEYMLDVYQGCVVGLHPMFAPDVENIKGQTIVACHGRAKDDYQWLIQQLSIWQANIIDVPAQKHDQTMAIVQVLRHFSTIAYGVHLMHEDVSLPDVLAMSSPIYRLELGMVGRLFAQDPDLYTEIIFSNRDNIAMMERYIERFDKLLMLLKADDKAGFKQAFLQTREWFGRYAEKFMHESSQMLAVANNISKDDDKIN